MKQLDKKTGCFKIGKTVVLKYKISKSTIDKSTIFKLNRLQTGVGRFYLSMHKWGLTPSLNCECGASEQTADHVLTACPIHWAPHGARGLTVLDDKT